MPTSPDYGIGYYQGYYEPHRLQFLTRVCDLLMYDGEIFIYIKLLSPYMRVLGYI